MITIGYKSEPTRLIVGTADINVGPHEPKSTLLPITDNDSFIDVVDDIDDHSNIEIHKAPSTERYIYNEICGDASLFIKLCKMSEYPPLVRFHAPLLPICGKFELASDHITSLVLNFKRGSEVRLTINCPNLIHLDVTNCSWLDMGSMTKPRRLELNNAGGLINEPSNIDTTKIHIGSLSGTSNGY